MSRAAVLVAFGYGAYLLYAFATGALYFYIHPIYVAPTVATGVVLLALALLAARAPRGPSGHPCEPAPRGGTPAPRGGEPDGLGAPGWLPIAILALPLALGLLLPPKPLGLATAAQRGVGPAPPGGAADLRPDLAALSRPPEELTIKDWVKAFQADPEPARHAGKPVRVTGFVYRDARLPKDWFLVARFVVQCCAVDAQPVGLPVRAAGHGVPEEGEWVSVEGTWEVAAVGGERRAVIAAARVAPTGRPAQPYLY